MSRTADNINILRQLNFRKMWNLILLRSSYQFSRIFKKSFVWGRPYALSIEPTTACNLGCPECPSGLKQFTRPTGKLDLELHRKMLEQTHGTVFYINYYFQGEPFLHPKFLDLIKDAKKYKIYTSTSTNAHFIDKRKAEEIVRSGLDRLIISVDGLSQETYVQYRVNGKLEKVISGIKEIVTAKQDLNSKTPHLIIQFLAVRPNEREIPKLHAFASELGVQDVRIKTAQLYDYKHGNPLMPDNEQYARYKKRPDGTYKLKYKLGNHCWRMWSSSVLTWDGAVVPCCFDKDAKHILGKIDVASFNEVWQSKAYQEFRKGVLTHRNQIDICTNCSEGAKVWA
ncbi:MAG: radical SAM protein [Bacteroidetes bacterium]|nr:MAG: radical SAM protein [Bacteroidota bacterium]